MPSRIEDAADECKKTENVDIDKLISNCKNSMAKVDALLSMEHDSIRLVSERINNLPFKL